MSYIAPITIDLVIHEAEKENLYLKLVEQINKDFNRANVSIDLPLDSNPEDLKEAILDKIYGLILHKFDDYLTLLYIVDISECQMKKLDGSDILELAKKVTFLILERQWMKVWFRNKYS